MITTKLEWFFSSKTSFYFFFTWFGRRANNMIMPQPVIMPEKQVPCEGIHSGAKIIDTSLTSTRFVVKKGQKVAN